MAAVIRIPNSSSDTKYLIDPEADPSVLTDLAMAALVAARPLAGYSISRNASTRVRSCSTSASA
jgi:hypothetical protein